MWVAGVQVVICLSTIPMCKYLFLDIARDIYLTVWFSQMCSEREIEASSIDMTSSGSLVWRKVLGCGY